MTFLSLAQGDPAARMLLSNAIKARYGLRPVPFSSLSLTLTRTTPGPLGLPVLETIQIRQVGTTHWRSDETRSLFGMTLSRFTESYDGGTLYIRKGGSTQSINAPDVLAGMRNLSWVWSALFLMPLTEEGVTLKAVETRTLQATLEPDLTERATLSFNDDATLESVQAQCYDAAQQRSAFLTLRPQDGLNVYNDFTVPASLIIGWDNTLERKLTIAHAETNPKIPLTEFSLGRP